MTCKSVGCDEQAQAPAKLCTRHRNAVFMLRFTMEQSAPLAEKQEREFNDLLGIVR